MWKRRIVIRGTGVGAPFAWFYFVSSPKQLSERRVRSERGKGDKMQRGNFYRWDVSVDGSGRLLVKNKTKRLSRNWWNLEKQVWTRDSKRAVKLSPLIFSVTEFTILRSSEKSAQLVCAVINLCAVWQWEESVAPVCIILYIRYELILDRLYEIEIYCLGYLNWFSWLKWSILAPSADCISYEFDLFSVSKYLVCIYIFPFHGDEVFEPHTAFRPMSDHILWFVAALCSIKTIRRKICIVCFVLLSCHTAE